MSAQSFLIRTTFKTNSEVHHWEFTSTLLALGTHSNIPSQKALRQVWHNTKSGCPRVIFGLSLWAVRSVALSLMRNKFSLYSASTVTCSHAELQLFSQYLVSCMIEFLFPQEKFQHFYRNTPKLGFRANTLPARHRCETVKGHFHLWNGGFPTLR